MPALSAKKILQPNIKTKGFRKMRSPFNLLAYLWNDEARKSANDG